MTAGLRWNIFQPLCAKQGKIGAFNPTIPNPRADGFLGGIEFYGEGAGRNGIRNINDTYYKAFSPHFGLAYRLNPKTVIRASYSLSTLPFWTKPTFQIPTPGWNTTLNPQTLDSGITPAFNWEGEFPQQFPTAFPILDPSIANGTSVRVIDRSENIPAYSQNLRSWASQESAIRGPASVSLRPPTR